MDSTKTAAMKDLILVLYDKLKIRDPSLEWKDLLPSDSRTTTRTISSLALTPDDVLQDIYADIREEHNGFLPVTALPLELVAKIFQEVLQLDRRGSHKVIRTNLSLVCRQWRRVVIGSPALWTRWHLPKDGLDYFRRARGLSKSLGLELSYTERSDHIYQDMLDAIYDEMYWWQDVDISSSSSRLLQYPEWPKLGNTTTPKLRKLRLDAPCLSSPLDLFDPSDPCNLEELSLAGARVVWEGWNLRRLRKLSLYSTSEGPSEVQLLRILERSPELEYLSLVSVNTSSQSTDVSIPNEPVCLPHLLTLYLANTDYNSSLVVRMMRFPQCKYLVHEGMHLDIADLNSASSFAHLIPVIGNIMKVGQVTLDVTKDYLGVYASAKGETYLSARFRIRGDPQFGLNWFIDGTSEALDASPDVNMKFSSNFSYDGMMEIISSLGRLRGITRLNFDGRSGGNECNPLDCLDNLGDQIRHVFPRLYGLECRIDSVSELESLRKVVLCRNGTSSSQEGIEMSPLRAVSVHSYTDWTLQGHRCDAEYDEIRAAIPGGDLKINDKSWTAMTVVAAAYAATNVLAGYAADGGSAIGGETEGDCAHQITQSTRRNLGARGFVHYITNQRKLPNRFESVCRNTADDLNIALMDSTTTAAMKDLILVLCDRLKSQDPSLEWKDLLPGDRRITKISISSLAFTPDHVLQKIYTDIREQHNGFLPVTALPPELLAKIFQEVLQLDRRGGNKSTRTKLSLVCRQWRRLVIGSPALWTRWHLPDDGLNYFRWARGLSKSLGLELYYTQPSDHSDQKIWGAIYKEMYRWQDLDITSSSSKLPQHPKWPKLGNTTTPKLRKLYLEAPYLSPPLDLFDPSDPCNLEELALGGTAVVWEGWNLQRLRDLSIVDIVLMARGPSEIQLLRILEGCPQLEHLSLIDVATTSESTGLSMPNEPVCLPHLLTLQLSNVDYNSDLIVRMMRFPQCKCVVLEGIHLDIANPNSASSLAHLIPVIGNIVKASQMTLDVTKDELEVFARAKGGMKLRATFRIQGDPQFGLNWFIDATSAALDASPDVNMKFYSNLSYDSTMEIISSLGRLRGITRLDFEGRPEEEECNPLDCLDNLGDQIRHVFPRLEILGCRIDTVSELESLRRVVLCRNGTSSSQEGIEMSPLREVIVQRGDQRGLRGRYDAGFGEIKALIPGGNLEIRSGRGRP